MIQKIAIEKALTRMYRNLDSNFNDARTDCKDSFAIMTLEDA